MLMSPATFLSDENLIAAWHSDKTATVVAMELGLPVHHLYDNWRRLYLAGRLPASRRRHVLYTSRPLHSGIEDVFDGRPSLKHCDLLLERLREVHGKPRCDFPPGLEIDVAETPRDG